MKKSKTCSALFFGTAMLLLEQGLHSMNRDLGLDLQDTYPTHLERVVIPYSSWDFREEKLNMYESIDDCESDEAEEKQLIVFDVSGKLRGNFYQAWPDYCWRVQFLRVLNISGNLLYELPYDIAAASNLEHLDVSDNYLSTLPTGSLSQLTKLVFLNASKNRIPAMPTHIWKHCNSLEIINFSENEIDKLPKKVWLLPKLKVLILSENKLTTLNYLPNNSPKARQLTKLHLENNNLKEFPFTRDCAPNLKNVTLDWHSIQLTPEQEVWLSQILDDVCYSESDF